MKRDFEEIYKKFFTPVFRYILARVRNRSDAEDIAQSVFLKVMSRDEDISGGDSGFLKYFFTVSRNAIIDHWRKKGTEGKYAEREEREEYVSQETPMFDKEAMNKVLAEAMELLSDEQQEVIAMKFFSELSNKDVSAIMGKSEEAIRQAQSRALMKLKDYFKGHPEVYG